MSANAEVVGVSSPDGLRSAPAIAHPLAFRLDHVTSTLESSADAPLMLIQAPAGYGKTTVLSFLAAQKGPSARWVTLAEGDRSIGAMIARLISAIYGWSIPATESVSDVGESARWIVGAMTELAISTIILDDYETVASSEEVATLIEAVAEKLPAHSRFVVASEQPPAFLKRARLRQMIVELDASDLRFDADDVARYIREIHKYDISDAAAASIARRSGGWAAIVNLVGQLCHNLPTYLRIDFEALPLGTTTEHMTLLVREFLARSGHPPARAARALLAASVGTPGGSNPTDSLLDFLEERHCLAIGFEADPPVIAAHKLLVQLASQL